MKFTLHTNGDLVLTMPHSEIDAQILILKQIECKDPMGQKEIDDLLNTLQLLRAGYPYQYH